MTKKIGIVGSMINTSYYLLFKDLGERYILKRYDSIEQANNDDCDCIIVFFNDKLGLTQAVLDGRKTMA